MIVSSYAGDAVRDITETRVSPLFTRGRERVHYTLTPVVSPAGILSSAAGGRRRSDAALVCRPLPALFPFRLFKVTRLILESVEGGGEKQETLPPAG